MKLKIDRASCLSLWCAVAGAAMAQQPAPPAAERAARPTAQSEAGDPRADTSTPSTELPPAGKPADNGVASPDAPGRAAGKPTAAIPATGKPAPASPAAAKVDRLELGTATVTGDREQPKVMYIVPWKRSDIGDLAGRPMNSLVDEILMPVDRDVFKREVAYYQALRADSAPDAAPQNPAGQGEK